MSATALVTLISQVIWLLVALLTLIDLLRHRDPVRLDVLLMLGDLAVIVALQLITGSVTNPPVWLGLLMAELLIAHPYLLLRLVRYFRPIPQWLTGFAVAGLGFSWLAVLILSANPPAPVALAIVAYFALVEGYATLAFVRGALSTSGVTHWRMLLAAIGSGAIAAVILLAGLTIAVPADLSLITVLTQLCSVTAVLGYYLGFATPFWLRRSWQLYELHRFLNETLAHPVGEQMAPALERLCSAALRSVFGLVAVVALWDKDETHLVVRATSDPRLAGVYAIGEGAIRRAWRECVPVVALLPSDFETTRLDADIRERVGALLAIPIATRERAWGLLIVFARRIPLFVIDDLQLLALFCEQTAMVLGYAGLLEEQKATIAQLHLGTQRLETLNRIDRAILAARSSQEVARLALEYLSHQVPCQRAMLAAFNPESQRAHWMATLGDSEVIPPEELLTGIQGLFPSSEFLFPWEPRIVDEIAALDPCPPLLVRAAGEGFHSALIAPITAENVLVGCLFLLTHAPGAFRPEHLTIVREIADQLAIAIQQARLREELERRAVELEQRVAERTTELEVSNRELEAFSYSVSHDLRTPLASIEGFSQLALQECGPQLPEAGRGYLELIHDNAVAMSRLVSDLLDFSRLTRQSLKKQIVAPAELVAKCIQDLQTLQQGREVEWVIGELPECEADPILFKQVWMNLLSNALKFTRRRAVARIEIGCKVAELQGYRVAGLQSSKVSDDTSSSSEGRQGLPSETLKPGTLKPETLKLVTPKPETIYFVKDNGVGFDEEQADKLFGVFQRFHHEEDYEGTGVGLAIVERIIHRHGGRIWAEAKVDQGAAFYFTLGG